MSSNPTPLSPLDAAFLYFETPTQPLHVGCVALLDGTVAFDDLVELIGERLLRFDRYRQRPVRPVLDLGFPAWHDAPGFDPRRHVRRVAVPPPGDDAALHELVDGLFATSLDPAFPLWECYLIEGIAGGRAAIMLKVHHCMIDGVSGAQLLEVLTDSDDGAPPPEPPRPATPTARAAGRVGPLGWLVERLERAQPLGQLQAFREMLQSIGTLATAPVSRLPFNGPLTGRRRIVWTSFAMDDLLAIRGAVGCKVNDVVLAIVAGALRHYLAARGVEVDAQKVRALVPVSLRRAHEHLSLGNLVAAMFPTLPVDVGDPLQRLRTVSREMAELKERGQARASSFFMSLLGQLPAPVEALLGRIFTGQSVINTVCTNVPGPAGVRSLLGQRVREIHPMVPLFEAMGLEFAILSYGGRLSITAAADPGLVPDAAALAPALEQSFRELRAAAFGSEAEMPLEPPRAALSVGDLMTSALLALRPSDSVSAAWRTMREARIRHLPIVAPDMRLVGLVTHRDILGHAPSDLEVPREHERVAALSRIAVGDLMETHLSTAAPEEPLGEAGRRMLRGKIGCLPVVASDGRLVGILTESDFVRWATATAEALDAPGTPAQPARM